MVFFQRYQPAECKTIDGTTIAGWLYTVDGPAPAIIMSHGFNCVKELTLPEVAEAFQASGFNVFLYDARSVGASGGQPRNLIDPLQMAEDLSDIYTYVAGLPSVDPKSIVLWGMSFGGVVSACSAAVDRRPKAVVMLRGNEPYQLAPFTPKGDNPIGMGGAGGPGGVEAYNLMKAASKLGHPDFRDCLTLQTYQKLAMFRPKEYMDMIRTPVMIIIPELDDISPPKEQREAFARIQSPKREYFAKGKGHLNIATGEGSKEMVAATVGFLKEALASTI
ncbi:hypothetical protein OCU04_007430 [Sclerotinia nivalis]|uniref:Serine aminopeptidase S33 domain-containing protein n=1 Tax=Sclerotinia nivalis TaxID=352851 RepID=A0A9X0DK01_9HELO|nr:hypothetical protein OCU04_007430 [Sclerotinia nivalis]